MLINSNTTLVKVKFDDYQAKAEAREFKYNSC